MRAGRTSRSCSAGPVVGCAVVSQWGTCSKTGWVLGCVLAGQSRVCSASDNTPRVTSAGHTMLGFGGSKAAWCFGILTAIMRMCHMWHALVSLVDKHHQVPCRKAHLHSYAPAVGAAMMCTGHTFSLTHAAPVCATLRLHLYGLVHPTASRLCMVHLAGLQCLVMEAPQNCRCSLAAVSCLVMPLCVGASDVCHGALERTTDCLSAVCLAGQPTPVGCPVRDRPSPTLPEVQCFALSCIITLRHVSSTLPSGFVLAHASSCIAGG
jgi:hypothetical protein